MLSKIQISDAIVLMATLLGIATSAQETQKITGVWNLAPAPLSLEGSVVEGTRTDSTHSVTPRYQLDCPATRSPENDACRSLSIYPAEVYKMGGIEVGGVMTARAEGLTSSWRCDIRISSRTPSGKCEISVTGPSTSYVHTSDIDPCFGAEHSIAVAITAGAEKLVPNYPYTWPMEEWVTDHAEWLSELGCPPRSTLIAPAITTSTDLTASCTPTTGPSPTGDQPAATDDTCPMSTSAGNGRASTSRLGCLVAVGGFFAVAIAIV